MPLAAVDSAVSDGWLLLAIAHLAATGAMAGISWMIQAVHYPLLRLVGAERYGEYQDSHMRRMTGLLVLPWGAETATALALAITAPTEELRALGQVGLACVGIVVILTVALAVPAHQRLLDGFDQTVHRRLLRADLARALTWTLRLVLAVAIVWVAAT